METFIEILIKILLEISKDAVILLLVSKLEKYIRKTIRNKRKSKPINFKNYATS
jgi:hypothetical protein